MDKGMLSMNIKINKLVQSMKRYDLDAVIATSPESVHYLSGYSSLGQPLGVFIAALLSKEGDITIVVPKTHIDLLCQEKVPDVNVRCYGEFYANFLDEEKLSPAERAFKNFLTQDQTKLSAIEVLSRVLKDGRLESARVGMEEEKLSATLFKRLKDSLPELRILEASEIFKRARMVKTEEEITLLGKAVQITEKGVQNALEIAREGVTEAELASVFEETLIEEHAKPLGTWMGFGAHSAFPNVVPSASVRLRKGDIIRFDVGCVYEGYCSDIARIKVFGKPSSEQKRIYEVILQGEQRTLEAVRAKAKACDLFSLAVGYIRKAGLRDYVRHHVGHGIGSQVYEPPTISPSDETPLERNMVINFETPYYLVGLGGFQVEDTVRVTDEGYEYLSKMERDLE